MDCPRIKPGTRGERNGMTLKSAEVNPLTPELNLSAQHCLPRFLLGILILKGSLIDVFISRSALTSEFNPSTQRCLSRIFLWILIFKGLTVRAFVSSSALKG
jgi:hypothetical protein